MTSKLPPRMVPLTVLNENGEQVIAYIGEDGREYGDPTPVAPPVGYRIPESTGEMIKRLVRGHLSAAAQEQGYETFEEAEDFDIPDDPLPPHTDYEAVFDPPVKPPATPPKAEKPPTAEAAKAEAAVQAKNEPAEPVPSAIT